MSRPGELITRLLYGDGRCAAATPLLPIDGLGLGLLVKADGEPRTGLLRNDNRHRELAGSRSGKMQLRLIAVPRYRVGSDG
jgi:hypothetical protein